MARWGLFMHPLCTDGDTSALFEPVVPLQRLPHQDTNNSTSPEIAPAVMGAARRALDQPLMRGATHA